MQRYLRVAECSRLRDTLKSISEKLNPKNSKAPEQKLLRLTEQICVLLQSQQGIYIFYSLYPKSLQSLVLWHLRLRYG